jgi:hypothetical protein
MGINSHVLPGDTVITVADCWLGALHPEERDPNVFIVEAKLEINTQCFVINVAPAGSAGGGHAFFVMTVPDNRFGWLRNHDVRSFVTQREVVGA